jgi:hypothetical protein
MVHLNNREIVTILHGLRMIQCGGRIEGCAAGNCEHFESYESLSDSEIDALCEDLGAKINHAEPDQNDEVKFCPDREKPNQFGELCAACTREREESLEDAL